MVWEEMSFEAFQGGIVAAHLHVSPMLHTKFQLNTTYRSGADVVSRFSRWPPWQPSWILERNISNSKSPSHIQSLGAIRGKVPEQTWFEYFQGGHLAFQNGRVLAILHLCVALTPPIKFRLNPPYCLGGDLMLFEDFQDG